MNNVIKSITLILFLGVLTLAQSSNFDISEGNKILLTAELNENGEPSLKWETSLEANYFKVYRGAVDDSNEISEELEYVEVGVSETNTFIDKSILAGKNMENISAFVYYVSVIDAYDKEIDQSDFVKLILITPVEIEETIENEGMEL